MVLEGNVCCCAHQKERGRERGGERRGRESERDDLSFCMKDASSECSFESDHG